MSFVQVNSVSLLTVSLLSFAHLPVMLYYILSVYNCTNIMSQKNTRGFPPSLALSGGSSADFILNIRHLYLPQ